METQEKIKQLKDAIEKAELYLSMSDHRTRNARRVKANLKDMEFQLWRLENPESYENHRQALQDYVDNTHIF